MNSTWAMVSDLITMPTAFLISFAYTALAMALALFSPQLSISYITSYLLKAFAKVLDL